VSQDDLSFAREMRPDISGGGFLRRTRMGPLSELQAQ
jgi:hypothetical protein